MVKFLPGKEGKDFASVPQSISKYAYLKAAVMTIAFNISSWVQK